MSTRALLLVGLLVVTGLALVYGPHVTGAGLVYEDAKFNDGYDRPSGTLLRGRGLSDESWSVIRTPRASHALNLALHLVVVALTAALLWQLTGHLFLTVATASIVGLHPLGMEGVAYASSRGELIAAIGVLLTLVCVTAPAAWAWCGIPLGLVLAFLGKETGLVAVPLIPLVLWRQGQTRLAARIAWFLVGGACMVGLTMWPAVTAMMRIGEYAPMSPLHWALVQSAAIYRLVVLSVAPLWLSVSPDMSRVTGVASLSAVVLLAGLLETAWHLRHRSPWVTFGIVWCALVAVPRVLVRTPLSPFNEHQWYLALVGVACIWTAALAELGATCERWKCSPMWAGSSSSCSGVRG